MCWGPLPAGRAELLPLQEAEKASSNNAKITALALAAVALVVAATACVMWGIGTSPGMMLTGMNFFHYLAGTFFGAISIGVAAGVAIFTIKMMAHEYRLGQIEGALREAGEPDDL